MEMLGDLIDPLEQEQLTMEEAQALTSSPITTQLLDFSTSDDPDLFSEALSVSSSENSTVLATTIAAMGPSAPSCTYEFPIDPSVIATTVTATDNSVPSCTYDFSIVPTIFSTTVATTNPSFPTRSYDFCSETAVIATTVAATNTIIPSCSYDFPTDPTVIATNTVGASDTSASSCSYNFSSDTTVDPTTIAPTDPSISCYDFSMDLATLSSLLDDQPPDTQPNELIQVGYTEPTFDQLYSMGTMMKPVYEEGCLMLTGMSTCSFVDPRIGAGMMYLQRGVSGGGQGKGGYFPAMLGPTEAAMGVNYGVELLQHEYSPSSAELQVFGDKQQQQLDDSPSKAGRLSAEERKEKIHRYMKKRNERNFSKKIKYACRKTLADSRPRVRGRFAKNEESVENAKPSTSHECDDDDELQMIGKQEGIFDSSDILAHISGVNSFKYNYTLESWI